MGGPDHIQGSSSRADNCKTRQRLTVSPYKEVQVLQLGWQNDIEAGRRNFKAIEAAWKDYGYATTTVFCEPFCEPQAKKYETKVDIQDILKGWQSANDDNENDDPEVRRGQRQKLLIITYVGHGVVRDCELLASE